MRPLLLLSNDDGYLSPGLHAFQRAAATWADVVVVAPATEKSAASHALSLHAPLRIERVEDGVFALDGTPADCIYVALHSGVRLLPRRPDLVISGVNKGLNLGQDPFYSGTVAAAREGALRGIPGFAASADRGADYDQVAALASNLAKKLLESGKKSLLSLNVPARWDGSVRTAHLGWRHYEEVVYYREDPRGKEYLWLGGPGCTHAPDPGSDTEAYDAGAATLTPLLLNLTHHGEMEFAQSLLT
jgi:5'-nucleotidase